MQLEIQPLVVCENNVADVILTNLQISTEDFWQF